MLKDRMPESSIHMSLKYNGNAVRNGTMPIDDVVLALQGFAGAYGKVASRVLPESSHEIRVSGFKTGSFEVTIVGWITSQHGQEVLKALGYVSGAATTVLGIVKGVIELKKHTDSKPWTIDVAGSNNTIVVINSAGGGMAANQESLEILKSRLIDPELAKIVKPLEEGFVDDATIMADGDESPSVITSSDKQAFTLPGSESFHDTQLMGTLISNNKETRRGTFATGSGDRVPYHYTGVNPELFQSTYTFSGRVRVSCRAYFDDNLKLKRIDISSAEKVQSRIDFPEEKS